MDKLELLEKLTFGERIAEDESTKLKGYFVSTHIWSQVYNGKTDVIYGPKGSGKSAIYSILEGEVDDLFFNKNVLITSAENPRGNTVFKGLTLNPPTSEKEFVRLWKLYFLIITNSILLDWGINDENIKKIGRSLESSGLKPPETNLRSILKTCMDYVKSFGNIESLQPGIDLNEATGLPSGLSMKVSFREPNTAERKAGIVSVESLYELLNETLIKNEISLWILIDRLDVAFSENLDLETNALKALFIVYNDLKPYGNIELKIFLRDDIWRRITKQGFREASHITKTVTITWTRESLLNLIISRALNNEDIIKHYDVEREDVLSDFDKQEALFYQLFPDQVDQGAKKPRTLDWILSRVRDGLNIVAPRELIHLLNETISEQINLVAIGEDKGDSKSLFAPVALKRALDKVSKVRLEQTIYAEYPKLRNWIEKLEAEKAEHTPETLANLWKVELEEAKKIAQELNLIGFFEEKGTKQSPRYWIPFLYRNELKIIQGSAD
ncbi:hypothetical protein JRG66_12545 [Salinimicrobium tongyeongense]|uniref:ATPase n=1 Tax=Salinimicrobium tongyeongense TaxID=2809707 RepID=A0ABY6NPF3_9FLAO|nr:hypothetical protein [Salinimicrobium tongyeongense]UZH54790.1 hypothetical protein JRG66_12545 [Salinimicrobium tongyeongense]